MRQPTEEPSEIPGEVLEGLKWSWCAVEVVFGEKDGEKQPRHGWRKSHTRRTNRSTE